MNRKNLLAALHLNMLIDISEIYFCRYFQFPFEYEYVIFLKTNTFFFCFEEKNIGKSHFPLKLPINFRITNSNFVFLTGVEKNTKSHFLKLIFFRWDLSSYLLALFCVVRIIWIMWWFIIMRKFFFAILHLLIRRSGRGDEI